MSTVEEKVNKPLSQSTGQLTGEFFSDPSAYRQRIMTENANNPLDPLQVDALVGQRRGALAQQIAGNNSLVGANSDILNNYFNTISDFAQQASDNAYRNAQLAASQQQPDLSPLLSILGLGQQQQNQPMQTNLASYAHQALAQVSNGDTLIDPQEYNKAYNLLIQQFGDPQLARQVLEQTFQSGDYKPYQWNNQSGGGGSF